MVWKRPKSQGLEGLEKATKPNLVAWKAKKPNLVAWGVWKRSKSQILRLGGAGKGQKAKFGAWRGGGKGQIGGLGGGSGKCQKAKFGGLGWLRLEWDGLWAVGHGYWPGMGWDHI